MRPVGIYLHIPYCHERCGYCDFLTVTLAGKEIKNEFIDSMIGEISLWGGVRSQGDVETIYFGGGTPSICSGDQIDSLLKSVRGNFSVLPKIEITLEANPLTIDQKKAEDYLRVGVNRLSVGGQSSDDEMLAMMGRFHKHADSVRAINAIKGAGFKNISIDLIYGTPGQTKDKLKKDIDAFLSMDLDHLSCYQLTISDNHEWKKLLPDEGMLAELDLFLEEHLISAGYERYEVSNYCRGGKRGVHNSRYWNWCDYIGMGPGAHSFFLGGLYGDAVFGERYRNIGSMEQYKMAVDGGKLPVHAPKILSREDALLEYLLTHLRCINGFLVSDFESIFAAPFASLINHGQFELFLAHGFLAMDGGRVFSTREGLRRVDAMIINLCNINTLSHFGRVL